MFFTLNIVHYLAYMGPPVRGGLDPALNGLASSLVVSLGQALNGIASTFERLDW